MNRNKFVNDSNEPQIKLGIFKNNAIEAFVDNQVYANRVSLYTSVKFKDLYKESGNLKKEEMLSIIAISACLSKKRGVVVMTAANLEEARRSDKTWRALRLRKPSKVMKNDLAVVKVYMERAGFSFDFVKAKRHKVSVAYVPYELYCQVHGYLPEEDFEKMKKNDLFDINATLSGDKDVDQDEYADNSFFIGLLKKAAKKSQSAEVNEVLSGLVKELSKRNKSKKTRDLGDGFDETDASYDNGGDPSDDSND